LSALVLVAHGKLYNGDISFGKKYGKMVKVMGEVIEKLYKYSLSKQY
jgi:hypothetical protein